MHQLVYYGSLYVFSLPDITLVENSPPKLDGELINAFTGLLMPSPLDDMSVDLTVVEGPSYSKGMPVICTFIRWIR